MVRELSAKLEDYLGVVLRFQREKRFARVSDISSSLNVAKSAVTAALQVLSEKDLLNYKPYEPVTLTPEGEKQAEEILVRHKIILEFLQDVLTIKPERAAAIACEIEHAIDNPALEKFVCFLAFVGTRSTRGKTWLQEFEQFLKEGVGGKTCRECIRKYIKDTRDDLPGGHGSRSRAGDRK